MIPALVMAGGRGERMQAGLSSLGGAPVPKPLVPIRGVPLLERCLVSLLRAGFREITISVSAAAQDVGAFVDGRGGDLARAVGARVTCLREEQPLDTLGAVAVAYEARGPVLVINADNLTAIDLGHLIDHHGHTGASMTIAAHSEPFPTPFGVLSTDAGRVVEYREKARLDVTISSGVYVLEEEAVAAVPIGRPASVPWLVERLLAAGLTVCTYEHSAPWIDVNDAAAVKRGEALVAAHPELFERWPRSPDVEVVGAVIQGPDGVLLEHRSKTAVSYPGMWDTPGGKIEPGESPEAALTRELREELAFEPVAPRLLGVFDDLDPASRRLFRHHVFAVDTGTASPFPRLGQELMWLSLEGAGPTRLCPVVARSLAAVGRAR